MPRTPRALRRLTLALALLIVAQAVIAAGATVPPVAIAQGPTGAATTPLEAVLNPDGTLMSGLQLDGSIDTSGWEMAIDPDGAPRFTRAEAAVEPQQAGSGSWITNQGNQSGVVEGVKIFNPAGTNSKLNTIAVDGADVYIGGSFTDILGSAGLPVSNIARWNSLTGTWSDLGGGLNGEVHIITVIGNEVFVGGVFSQRVRRWSKNTQTWLSLGSGVSNTPSNAAVYTIVPGAGSDVYVGGLFSIGNTIRNIARWDRSAGAWYPLGTAAPTDTVSAIVVDGTQVIIGGGFSLIRYVQWAGVPDEIAACRIAAWDRQSEEWAALGQGVSDSSSSCSGGTVQAITIAERELYVGGDFRYAGGSAAKSLARWDLGSQTWAPVGGSITGGYASQGDPYVASLTAAGDAIIVAGEFSSVGGVQAYNIARWDRSAFQWSTLGAGLGGPVQGLCPGATGCSADTGSVSSVVVANGVTYAVGQFTKAEGMRYLNIARWDAAASRWIDLYGNYRHDDNAHGTVLTSTIIRLPGNNQPFPVLGGQFTYGSDNSLYGFDQDTYWRRKADFDLNAIYAIVAEGNTLYVGGGFGQAALSNTPPSSDRSNVYAFEMSTSANQGIILVPTRARPLGTGTNGPIDALALDGALLYAGGRFSEAGGVPASNIARWNTVLQTWAPLGAGVNGDVYAIAVSGSDVYVGGRFSQAGGVAASNIARWNSLTEAWSAVGGGVDGPVEALEMAGDTLYAGGRFTAAGGITARGLARWNGTAWAEVSGGVNGDVRAIAPFGQSLFVGGSFSQVGGIAAANIARLQPGTNTWEALGSGTDGAVETISAADGYIVVGGQFIRAGGLTANHFARYTYNPLPSITAIVPGTIRNDQNTQITITGSNFTADPKLRFSLDSGSEEISPTLKSDTQIVATLPGRGQIPCSYGVRVTNAYGESATRNITVTANPPVVQSVSPSQTRPGDTVSIYGQNFACGSTITFSNATISRSFQAWPSIYGQREFHVAVPSDLPLGAYNVTVDGLNGRHTLPNAVTLVPSASSQPSVAAITPVAGLATRETLLRISGANFSAGSYVTVRSTSGTVTRLINVLIISPSEISAVVPSGLPPGNYSVSVTTSQNLTGTRADAYEVMTTVADIGFDLLRHGYSFSNYSNSSVNEFTIDDMRQMLGNSIVCQSFSNGVCTPFPTIAVRHAAWIAMTAAGHCTGMAITSLRFWRGNDLPTTIQAGAASTFNLRRSNSWPNPPIPTERHITHYHVRQFTNPAASHRAQSLTNTPSAILQQLRAALTPPVTDPPTLILFNPVAGHEVTPYAIGDRGNGIFWVFIYDNNWPAGLQTMFSAQRHIVINTNTNTWSYEMGPGSVWSGNASTSSLALVPVSLYGAQQQLPNAASGLVSVGENEIWSLYDGSLVIADAQQRRIGYADGQFVNEIPGANRTIVPTGQLDGMGPMIYTLPQAGASVIEFNGSTLTRTATIDLAQFGSGFAVTINGGPLAINEHDQLTLTADGKELTYQASTSKPVSLTLALDSVLVPAGEARTANSTGESYTFEVLGADVSAGGTISLRVDTDQGRLALRGSQQAGTYSLEVMRSADESEQRFMNTSIQVAAQDTHYLSYTSWDGAGAMTLQIDRGSDGTIDEIILLANEQTRLYLPLIAR